MNLTTDAWINIAWNDGEPGTVGLQEAFERGDEIQDLALRPHERIAVMRLLICIAQAALDGPANYDDWKQCRPRIAPSAVEYLNRWRQAFELFGEGQRFLQVSGLRKPATISGEEEEGGNSTSKLDLALATGNNPTLFDNAGGSERRFNDARLAIQLLTFQCFSPCGTIGVALWNGSPTIGWHAFPTVKPGQSAHAPCLSGNMLHSYVRGSSLLDSVHSNLVTKDQAMALFGDAAWGEPMWERVPSGANDKARVQNATTTYLGRLAPLSRAVRLVEDRRSMILANALEYPGYPEWRESSATIVTRGSNNQSSRVALAVSVDKSAWRELHALTVIAVDKSTNGGPIALQNVQKDKDFDIWVGGLVAEGNGKLVDTTESVFHIPAAMLTERSQRVYEDGVKHAERVEYRLKRAVSAYHSELSDNLDRLEYKNRRQQIQSKATAHFWTDIEQAAPVLLKLAESPGSRGLKGEWRETAWGQSVRRSARTAYEHSCPRQTARQIRAYVLGLNALFGARAEAEKKEVEA